MSNNVINARPTKEFFIGMLTRDIPLDRSILDLIDNSVDSANEKRIKDPVVKLSLSNNEFKIEDNCGGVSLDVAKNYAFRFGRPKDREETPSSVGQFGVGMKRTLFKIGQKFQVISCHDNICFRIFVDVKEWTRHDEWEFVFETINSGEADYISNGHTKIIVTDLYPEISEQLTQYSFINELSKEVSIAHFKSINAGMKLYINEQLASTYELKLISTDKITPVKKVFDNNGVKTTIIAGVSERKIKEGGWYVVCNGRLVVAAEQSKITGWKEDGIPQYHPDYAFFRGIVEMESSDSSLLPWTTTKTGIDKDNKYYKAALYNMKMVAREILQFLKERAKEDNNRREELVDETPLNDSVRVDSDTLVPISKITFSDSFIRPLQAPLKEGPNLANIQYKVSHHELELVQKALGVATAKDAGLQTFKYYFDYECK